MNSKEIENAAGALIALIREVVREELRTVHARGLTPADYRLRAGLSVQQLAKATGVMPDQVYRYERGDISSVDDKRIVSRMLSLCRVLGVDVVSYRQAVRAKQQELSRQSGRRKVRREITRRGTR